MKKEQIIGMLLIGALFVAWSMYNAPSEEEKIAMKKRADSLEMVQQQAAQTRMLEEQQEKIESNTHTDKIADPKVADANLDEELVGRYGPFAGAAKGQNEFVYIENDVLKLKISTRGGRVYSAELKEYQSHDSLPLIMFDGDSTIFGFDFFTHDNLPISTDKMFFSPEKGVTSVDATNDVRKLSMILDAGESNYIEYVYTLEPGSYMVDFDVRMHNMGSIISSTRNFIGLNWSYYAISQEKGRDFENQYSSVYYKFYQDEVDNLSERKDEAKEDIKTPLKWIGYKQQFFSTVLIADQPMSDATVEFEKQPEDSKFLKFYSSDIGIPFNPVRDENLGFRFYIGPNHYSSLNDHDLDLEELVDLGWGIFGWVNRFAVIPLFNFLGSFISNYGIIILIMTLIIKLVLFPLTYKSYMSSAKMRVLKPQVEEITSKIPKDKSMERQQKTMELYKKAGVNPMGGCLPMALQMPILIAMFRFFPASIELRQQSFLWATDLSSYDSIMQLPWDIPFYGDHVSLFTLLMTISTLIYTRINQNQMGDMNSTMPGMKTMMYFFPVMMLFWFNSYASGLSYYYFVANVITFSQMLIIKRFVNEKEILKKLETNKKKPTKKSGFQDRIEKMAKEKGYKKK